MAHTQSFAKPEFAHFSSLQLDLPRSTPANTSFLFVVKTPNSGVLSRSTSRTAAASINSHAQRWAQESGASKGNQPLHEKASPGVNSDLRFESCVNRCRIDRLGGSGSKVSKPRRSAAVGDGKSSPSNSKSSKGVAIVPSEPPTTILSKKRKSSTTSPVPVPVPVSVSVPVHQLTKLNPTPPTIPAFSFSTTSVLDYIRIPSLSLDSNSQSVLQYYLSFVLLSTPERGPHNTSLPRDLRLTQHSSTIRAIVQGCLQETVHLYALLAATASRMKRVSGIQFAPDHGPESYLSKALQGLRALLTVQMASSDRQLVLDIYYLSVCEWYLGSYDAANTHSNFLKHLVKSLPPGASEFDQYVYDMLCYDNTWLSPAAAAAAAAAVAAKEPSSQAAEDGPLTSSLVPYQPCPPQGHHVWDLKNLEPDARCCSALSLALQGPTYSQDLRKMVRDLPPILTLFKHFNSHTLDEAGRAALEAKQLVASCSELARRLLEKPSYGNELCCRLALILNLRYMAQIAGATSTKRSVPPSTSTSSSISNPTEAETALSIQRLRRQLQYEILLPSNEISRSSSSLFSRPPSSSPSYPRQEYPVQHSPPFPPSPSPSSVSSTHPMTPRSTIWTGDSDELLLWILITGLFAARNSNLDDDEVYWFGTRATALMQLLDIKTHDQLKDLMLSFFAVDEMLHDDLLPRPCVCVS